MKRITQIISWCLFLFLLIWFNFSLHPVSLHQLSHTQETPYIRTNTTKLMFGSSPPCSWSRLQDKRKTGHSDSTLRVSQVWKRDLTGCDSLKLCLSSHLICDCCLFSLVHLVSRCVFTVKDFTSQRKVDNSVNFFPEMTSDLFNVPESKVGKLQIRDVN